MFRAPRGTLDVLPSEQPYWKLVIGEAERLCALYGYQRLDSPLFEDAGLFQRSVGQGTDIVEKETYDFRDRSGELLTLRPEGTAPVCRAYLEHGMHNLPQPVKLYYVAPSFRYERPQAGRYRQFWQFGYEAIGVQDPALDAEVVDMAWRFFSDLGLRGLTVLLNSIGDATCRRGYLEALRAYYEPHTAEVCKDCRVRLERNPLRLLDCKEPQDQPLVEGAPKTVDYLCEACAEHFRRVESYLKDLGVPCRLEHRLVRGLDYYTRTVFEVVPEGGGSQSSVGAGGRYDGLIEELGGRPAPAIGFAAGIERVILNLKRQRVEARPLEPPLAYLISLGEAAKQEAVRLSGVLRSEDVPALLSLEDRSLRAQLRHAGASGARFAVILGENEMGRGAAVLRRMSDGQQWEVPLGELAQRLRAAAAEGSA